MLALAGSAHAILIPEIPYDITKLVKKIRERESLGRKSSIVVVSEGARPKGGEVSFEQLLLPVSLPPPDFQQLVPTKASEEELARPLAELLAINFKLPDWMML